MWLLVTGFRKICGSQSRLESGLSWKMQHFGDLLNAFLRLSCLDVCMVAIKKHKMALDTSTWIIAMCKGEPQHSCSLTKTQFAVSSFYFFPSLSAINLRNLKAWKSKQGHKANWFEGGVFVGQLGNKEATGKQLDDPDTISRNALIKLTQRCLPTVKRWGSHNTAEQHPFVFKGGLMAFPFSCHPLLSHLRR